MSVYYKLPERIVESRLHDLNEARGAARNVASASVPAQPQTVDPSFFVNNRAVQPSNRTDILDANGNPSNYENITFNVKTTSGKPFSFDIISAKKLEVTTGAWFEPTSKRLMVVVHFNMPYDLALTHPEYIDTSSFPSNIFFDRSSAKGGEYRNIPEINEAYAKGGFPQQKFQYKSRWTTGFTNEKQVEKHNSPQYQKLQEMCDAANQLGMVTDIDAITDDVLCRFKEYVTEEKKQQIQAAQDAMWDDIIDNFDSPQIQSLVKSFGTSGLSVQASGDPDFQEEYLYELKTVAEVMAEANRIGIPTPTYIQTRVQWMNRYEHRIKSGEQPLIINNKLNCAPISEDAIAQVYGNGDFQRGLDQINKQFAQYLSKPLTTAKAVDKFLGNRTDDKTGGSDGRFRGAYYALQKAMGSSYNAKAYNAYYDVSQTEYIGTGVDPFLAERRGYTNNLQGDLTPMSQKILAQLKAAKGGQPTQQQQQQQTAQQAQQACGDFNRDSVEQIYNGAVNYLKWQQNGSDTNKKYDVFVRYNTSLSDDQLKGECYRLFQAILGNIITGNPKFTGPRIEFITCMLMCALHIDWKPAVKKFGTDKATIKQNFGNDKRILNNLHMEFILWGMEMKKKANGGANTANIAESLQHNMNENKDVDLVWSIFVGDDDDEDWFNDNSTQKPGSNTFSQSNIMNRENTAEALEEAKKFNNTFYNLFEKINR